MVGSFGVSDPVTGGVETREDSASDSDPLLNGENRLKVRRLNERHRLSFPTAFPSRNREKVVRLRGLCREDLYYYLYLLVAQTLFHPFLH